MKNAIKITLSILLCAALLSGYSSLLSASADNIAVGSIISFGTYPKSLVTDPTLIDSLTKSEGRCCYTKSGHETGRNFTLKQV